ncbi:hypothetical protein M409DRAFT_61634 [Zasmidium cellare ATCC 36951]|uniref:Uncharacterized protein n=1 Tax=Zasmidium cellare ATCC 36951 TaxID=1080233 RepID=A0A6A6BY45_ZASCE|nr:uncharacterized protein M409DRAFT_61634 [Zasmidium cellare ATCC 36951]KAF2158449.1 hypothetical protein M409DRAFT_61634 [Zasmidium cellare ATCC 36951]
MFAGIIGFLGLTTCLAAAQGNTYYGYALNGVFAGVPLIYSDVANNKAGNAYLSYGALSPGSTLNDSVSAYLTDQSDSERYLVINNDPSAFAPVEFQITPDPTLTSTGFGLYGPQLFWSPPSGGPEGNFFADPVDDNVWEVKWNVDNTAGDSTAVEIVLRSVPAN